MALSQTTPLQRDLQPLRGQLQQELANGRSYSAKFFICLIPLIGRPCVVWIAHVLNFLAVIWYVYFGISRHGIDMVKSKLAVLARATDLHLHDSSVRLLTSFFAICALANWASLVIAQYALHRNVIHQCCEQFNTGSKLVRFLTKEFCRQGGCLTLIEIALFSGVGILTQSPSYDVCCWLLFVLPHNYFWFFHRPTSCLLIRNGVFLAQSGIDAMQRLLDTGSDVESVDFWLETMQRYKALEAQFHNVFVKGYTCHLILALNTPLLAMGVLCGCIAALTGTLSKISFTFIIGSGSLFFLACALFGFWPLAVLSDDLQSIVPGKKSVHRLALDHFGNIKSNEAAARHAQFVQLISASPVGVALPVLGFVNTRLLKTIIKLLPIVLPVLFNYIRSVTNG